MELPPPTRAQSATFSMFQVANSGTMFTALYQAGGPTEKGTMRGVELKRGGRTVGLLDVDVDVVEIEREGLLVPAPRADEVLQAGDRLVVNARVGDILALERASGLLPVSDHEYTREAHKRRTLLELVVSDRCPLVGQVVGQGSFRRRYNAAVVAIQRQGERIVQREEGGWRLSAGDTLLVEASDAFLQVHRTNPDFYLVTSRGGVEPAAPWHRWFSFFNRFYLHVRRAAADSEANIANPHYFDGRVLTATACAGAEARRKSSRPIRPANGRHTTARAITASTVTR